MFDHCLYFNTTSLARLLEREWSLAFKAFDLSPPQAFLLRMVLNQPGILQHELADALTIARPTATRLLDKLQDRKLIDRRPSERDGRESEIHPTSAARAIEASLNEASGSVTRRLKKRLGADLFANTVDRMRDIRRTIAL